MTINPEYYGVEQGGILFEASSGRLNCVDTGDGVTEREVSLGSVALTPAQALKVAKVLIAWAMEEITRL